MHASLLFRYSTSARNAPQTFVSLLGFAIETGQPAWLKAGHLPAGPKREAKITSAAALLTVYRPRALCEPMDDAPGLRSCFLGYFWGHLRQRAAP